MPTPATSTTLTGTPLPPGVTLPAGDDTTVLLLGTPGSAEFRERLEREAVIRVDTAPHFREAMLTFSTKYGVFPPAYAMMRDTARLCEFTALVQVLRDTMPHVTSSELLEPYHDRIVELLANNASTQEIVNDINCDRDNLRAYLKKHGLT